MGDPGAVREGFLEEAAPQEGLGRSPSGGRSCCKGPRVGLIVVLEEQSLFYPKVLNTLTPQSCQLPCVPDGVGALTGLVISWVMGLSPPWGPRGLPRTPGRPGPGGLTREEGRPPFLPPSHTRGGPGGHGTQRGGRHPAPGPGAGCVGKGFLRALPVATGPPRHEQTQPGVQGGPASYTEACPPG